ncbi:MAG TPA: DinB family protein [Flavobacteriales bacterium]
MATPGEDLRATIEETTPRLLSMTDDQASRATAPDKWCPKEVIGHLLDSANNNLARFVRLQATDDLFFEPYDQEHWVRVQGHADSRWTDLVELWSRYNLHIAQVMDRVPADILHLSRPRHRPLGSTYAELPADGIPTLDWLMRDYMEHLKHHLRQIDPRSVG